MYMYSIFIRVITSHDNQNNSPPQTFIFGKVDVSACACMQLHSKLSISSFY